MQSFVDSGYREPIKRLSNAVRENIRFQLMYLGIGIIGIIYIAMTATFSTFTEFKGLLIALTNTWGLVLALYFMGHGLVNLPRRIWKSADYAGQVRELESHASSVWEKKEEAASDERDLANEVIDLSRFGVDEEWLNELKRICPAVQGLTRFSSGRSSNRWFGGTANAKAPTDVELAQLTRKVRYTVANRERYTHEWSAMVDKYVFLQDVLNAKQGSGRLLLSNSQKPVPPRIEYLYYAHGLPLGRKLAAIVAGFISFSIVWAELFVSRDSPYLRYITLPIAKWHSIELLSALLLAYMATCAYSTLLRLRVFNRYALIDGQRTASNSLFFYSSYLCRLTIPLSYNFVSLLPPNLRAVSTFSEFLGKAINLQPLGRAFNDWLPLFILLPVGLTLVNSYDAVKNWLGNSWLDDEDDVNGTIIEGRTLLRNRIIFFYLEGAD